MESQNEEIEKRKERGKERKELPDEGQEIG